MLIKHYMKNVIINLLHLIQNQNIGVKKMEILNQDKYLRDHIKNIYLIVMFVITN